MTLADNLPNNVTRKKKKLIIMWLVILGPWKLRLKNKKNPSDNVTQMNKFLTEKMKIN